MRISILGAGNMGGAILIICPRKKYELALIDPKIDKIWKSLGKSIK